MHNYELTAIRHNYELTAQQRLNHSTHVHLAVQREPNFRGVPMQSILANHIVSGGTLAKFVCPMSDAL